MSNIDIEIVDFLDLINETLSYRFVERWRHKYSEKFVKNFQNRIMDNMQKNKPLKLSVLFNHLTRKCKYSEEQVRGFFRDIDIDLYHPLISGSLQELSASSPQEVA